MSRLENDLAWARSGKRKKMYVLRWSFNRTRIVPTKKRGLEVLRAWKKWHERQGFKIRSSPTGYVATKGTEQRAAVVRAYCPHTLKRLD